MEQEDSDVLSDDRASASSTAVSLLGEILVFDPADR